MLISPILVGRSVQLEALSRALDETRNGRGQVVLLAGEAGIGKSRLAREIQQGTGRDFVFLRGRCFDQDRTLPYAPLIDLLSESGLVSTLTHADSNDRAALAKIVPELSPRLQSTIASQTDSEQDKRRLYVALYHALTARLPALVLIEDLHWCDDNSLEFLLYLARRIETQPLLLLLTYRPEETSPVLDSFLATLERERRSTEISLKRLTASEVAEMVRAISARTRPPTTEFVQTIYELTEGNPFFVEEILKSLPEAEDQQSLTNVQIPRTVHDAVQSRVHHMSLEAQKVLTFAAVAGRRFDFALLHAVTGRAEHEVLKSIKELIAAQLIVQETLDPNTNTDQFAFRHALMRKAIYDSLLRRERTASHLALLDALEKIYADPAQREQHAAELAYHAMEAGVWDKAFKYAQRAGEQAAILYAPRAAVEQFTRVLNAVSHFDPGAADLVAVYRSRAYAYEILGEFEPARTDYLKVLDLARTEGARRIEWQALLDLGFLWAARDANSTQTYLEQALYVARTLEEPATLARTLNRVGNWHTISIQPLRAYELHQEALEIFETLGDDAGRAETFDLLGVSHLIGGDFVTSAAFYERAIPLWRALNDRRGLSSSLSALATCNAGYTGSVLVSPLLPLSQSVQFGQEAFQLAHEIDWRAGEAVALAAVAIGLGGMGEYGPAFDSAHRAVEIAREIEHRQYSTVANWVLGVLYLDVLAYDVAQTYLERALLDANVSAPNWVPLTLSYLASVHIEQNDFSRAEALLNTYLTPDLGARATGERFVWTVRGELALAQGDAPFAQRIAKRLQTEASHGETYGIAAMPRVAWLYGKALMASRRKAEAANYLDAAIETARERGANALLWRALIARGKLYRTMARSDAARQSFARAHDLIQSISNSIPDAAVREHFLKQAQATIPQAHSPTADDLVKKRFGGLSPRERQIATRVAHGESNRVIAHALVLSQRTVESHVTNIMSKLGLTSRAQIAAWAAEHELI